MFARQVEAHGRPGDVLVLLSTSGRSSNVLHAAKRGLDAGLHVWAMTGPAPNPLAGLADEAVVVDAPTTAAVQEVHLVAIHALCAALDAALERRGLMQAGPVVQAGLDERAATSSSSATACSTATWTGTSSGSARTPRRPWSTSTRSSAPRAEPGSPRCWRRATACDVTLVAPSRTTPTARGCATLLEAAGVRVLALGHGVRPGSRRGSAAGGQSLARIDTGGPGRPLGGLAAEAGRGDRRRPTSCWSPTTAAGTTRGRRGA